jgi:hypothetical protein
MFRYIEYCNQIHHFCSQGASTTVIGSKMYLFVSISFLSSVLDYNLTYTQGGRLVTERKMVSDLYMFDLETFRWERMPASPHDDVPRARYFHSTDACM